MKVTLSKLTTKNLATLAQRVINSSVNGNYIIIQNHPLLVALKASYTNYDAVYTKLTFSGKGIDVAAADAERDAAFSNLKAFLNGYRKLASAANYQDAEFLYGVFKSFGLNMNTMNYSEETAQLKKLIEALEEQQNMQRLIGLGLETAMKDLKTKQLNFESIFASQAEANAELREMASASSIRKDLEQNLRSYLNLLAAMKDVPNWAKIYFDINEIVKAAKNS